MREGIMKKLDRNLDMKVACETLVKNLPEGQREKMVAMLAARTKAGVADIVSREVSPVLRKSGADAGAWPVLMSAPRPTSRSLVMTFQRSVAGL